MIISTLLLCAASSFAATAKSYDASFTLEVPSGLAVTPAAAFSRGPEASRPYIALEKRGQPMPVLIVMPVAGADAKETGERELKSFAEHNKGNAAFKPSALEAVHFSSGVSAYRFSNGHATQEYTFTYVPFQGRVLKAGCPAATKAVCAGILGTIKPLKKAKKAEPANG